MALSGNKGEWSEIYTLFRLLGEGKVYAGDANLNRLNLYYPIINIIREESRRYEYKPNLAQNLVVIDEDGNEFARFSMDDFMQKSGELLEEIKQAKASSFPVVDIEEFMGKIGCTKLKAPSKDKSDIHIVIHDLRTNMKPMLGFSIKPQLGSPSTLLNPGESTNITFRVIDDGLSDEDINRINSIKDHLPRMAALSEMGCSLAYYDIEHQTFKNNLLFLDTCMPEFIAKCLIVSNTKNSPRVKDVVSEIAKENPFGFQGRDVVAFYEHKMKVLLIDAALGMTPAKEWKGHYDANGGYLVVKKDGDIVCYHFYNRNDVEDYLYYNTRLDRASRSRYHFGSLYRGSDGAVYMRLNLQIRFIK